MLTTDPKITVQQVEEFIAETYRQFRESTGASYTNLTLEFNGINGPQWSVYTGSSGVTNNRGRDLYALLTKEADAINPARRAAALREKAEELRRQADSIEGVGEATIPAHTVEALS